MMKLVALLALTGAAAETYFEEDFSGDWEKTWTQGQMPGKEMGKFTSTSGKWFVDEAANKGMATSATTQSPTSRTTTPT